MKTSLLSAAVMATMLAVFAATNLQGQATRGQPSAAGPVAVLDIPFVFKNSAHFKARMDGLKRDATKVEGDLVQQRNLITKKMEQAKALKPGSPQHNQLGDEITAAQANLKVAAAVAQKRFSEQRARTQFAVYQELTAAVKAYADPRGIALVLAFDGEPVDEGNAKSMMSSVFKPVVYNHRNIDITPAILDQLNRTYVARGGSRAAPRQQ